MIEAIKKHFNIHTHVVSGYIGSSISFVNSVLIGRRTLNLSQLNKLMVLYKALALSVPVAELSGVSEFIEKEKEESIVELKQLLWRIRKTLENKKNNLKKLQANRAYWLRGLHASNILLKEETLSITDKKWIRLRKKDLELQLREHSYYKELKMQTEIVALEQQIASLKQFV
ncbi:MULTISPECIES: hypothetical protein [unclassified Tenacibaculum]|uniref:hypothetical protein n=1 Tax=unclassified Tenacibaculum TaxID=2635139 RepID=UPI001F21DE98|nr:MULTISPECIES: hypothetical protein [unclassified Tenacibaculum]MCF2873364.1 hypothetical protein [Tenacibaculum sp. Cn5-1]MCF2933520.1 hypothetical protein [Tenacibaculum sp. Cn5-34]MCG7509898.1 hypothetical protein [Tenacibaculum sp. Cn5-46]